MKVERLASGNYRVRIMIDGKRMSFTDPDKYKVQHMVTSYRLAADREKAVGITVGQAIDRYIDNRRNTLSPTTISLYEIIRKKSCAELMSIPVSRLTNEDIQTALDREAATHKPKSVANMRGLLSAALRQHGFTVKASVPQNPKKIIELPDAGDVMRAVRGKDIELPALLAMWLSCSASEIRGIKVSSVKDGYVTIQGAVVDVDGVPTPKETNKAYERTRKLRLPEPVMDLIRQTDAWKAGEGYIVTMNRRVLYSHFTKAIEDAGLPHMTFHQLRHMNASVMLMLGISEKYAMERGGWATRSVLQNVYQHTFSKQREAVDDVIDAYFLREYEKYDKS